MAFWWNRNIFHPGWVGSRFVPTRPTPLVTSQVFSAIDRIHFYPFMLDAGVTFTGARIRTNTGAAGTSVKAGIWGNSSVSARPLGAPIYVDNTGVDTTANNTDYTLAIGAGSLLPWVIYWVGLKCDDATANFWAVSSTDTYGQMLAGGASVCNAVNYYIADTYANSMPTLAEGAAFTVAANAIPHVWLAT